MSNKSGMHASQLGASRVPLLKGHAQDAEATNKSNNPLNVTPGMNLRDYYNPKYYDPNILCDDLLVRGTLPIAPDVHPATRAPTSRLESEDIAMHTSIRIAGFSLMTMFVSCGVGAQDLATHPAAATVQPIHLVSSSQWKMPSAAPVNKVNP